MREEMLASRKYVAIRVLRAVSVTSAICGVGQVQKWKCVVKAIGVQASSFAG
jgi:hypothetical protein